MSRHRAAVDRIFRCERRARTCADLTKQHLDLFVGSHAKLSPKSRNHYRATLRMFFGWCQRRDYLAANHRLFEADGLRKEDADTGDVGLLPSGRTALDARQRRAGNGRHHRPASLWRVAVARGVAARLGATCGRVSGHVEISSGQSQDALPAAGGDQFDFGPRG